MNLNPLRLVVGSICFAVASYGSTVSYTEVAPTAVTCASLTASFTVGQGTCTNSVAAFVTASASVLGFSTTGATMAGLKVTAVFADGFRETLTWAPVGATFGVQDVAGAHQWSLFEPADTFTTPFDLANSVNNIANGTKNITDIILSEIGGVNGSGESTIFDRTSNPDVSGTGNEQTPGSHSGHDLAITAGNNGNTYDVLVTYSDIFRVTSPDTCNNSAAGNTNGERANAPCGDEWATLTIHFNGAGTSFSPGSTLSYMQDADNSSGVLTTSEPATISLLGVGLLAGGLLIRLRRKKPHASIRPQLIRDCSGVQALGHNLVPVHLQT